MGDPSGVGEGFAYVRWEYFCLCMFVYQLFLYRLPRLTRADKRKPKGRVLYNTDSDIRILHKPEAVKIAVCCYISVWDFLMKTDGCVLFIRWTLEWIRKKQWLSHAGT